MDSILLRTADIIDIPELYKVFVQSVSSSCINDYSPQQIEAWIDRATRKRWAELLLSDLHFIAAEDIDSEQLVGFTSIDPSGYLHSMFVIPEFQRQGVAALLLDAAEATAWQQDSPSIRSEVSITARPFFEKKGFIVEKQQTVEVNGVEMINFVMRKELSRSN